MKESYKSFDELPMMLSVSQVAKVLGISRTRSYELVNEKGFPKIKIGTRIVVPKDEFKLWIQKQIKKAYFGENTPLVADENGGYTRPVNFRKRYYRILKSAGIEQKGLHSLRHTFATNLVNGIKQADGSIKSLTPRQVADLLGHSTSQITELYYVKKDTSRLNGITEGFEM